MRTLVLGLVVMVGGCGKPAPAMLPDAGSADGAVDGSDAPVDAMPCASADDRDGDGVCDAVDLCPDTADPGQADLDGDHVGWMCDPVESITIPGDGAPAFFEASIHEDTFAARTKILCGSSSPPCGHVLLQVGAAGMLLARSDSVAAVDAWQASPAVTWMDGPLVTPDDRVLWSRGYDEGDTGDFDLATHTFTVRATGAFNPNDTLHRATVHAGDALLAVALSTSSTALTQNLVDVTPNGSGMLPIVHSAQGFTGFTSADAIAIPGPVRHALVPVRAQFAEGLKLYTQGQPNLAEVLVDGALLTGSLERLVIDGVPRGFCAQRGTKVYAIGWDASGAITSYQLPIADCHQVWATDVGAARIYFQQNGGPSVIGYVVGGTFRALSTIPGTVVVGLELPLLVVDSETVWSIEADGSSYIVESGIDGGLASRVGSTIHVLAHHPYQPGQTYGTWDLTRHRSGQPPQSVTVFTNEPNGTFPTLVTTAEGAAFVSETGHQSVIAPSGSMALVTSPVGTLWGGIRDGRTIAFAELQTGTSMGAPYLYTEVNGAPQFAAIDVAGTSMSGHLIDTNHPTSWFTYGNTAAGCRIARFKADGTLEAFPCNTSNAVNVLGTRRDGVIIVSDDPDMRTLAPAGAQRVGASHADEAIMDTAVDPPVLVGWSSAYSSNQRFSCLAMQPGRCWAYPAGFVLGRQTTANALAHGGMGSFQHILQQQQAIGQATLTIVRSIGPGTVTP